MRLSWHSYNYYPYERDLAIREVTALLKASATRPVDGGIEIDYGADAGPARHLTYFAGYVNGHGYTETLQAKLENAARSGRNRQATRYSVHGIHEYKGKFNPQIANALLNIFGIRKGKRVLDPFCGSGTTLVECAHRGAVGVGTDVNPLAVYIANAKLSVLAKSPSVVDGAFKKVKSRLRETSKWATTVPDDLRGRYLSAWFDPDILQVLEITKTAIERNTGELAPIFLTLASNLLRDYSMQDPQDLRIRRRKSALPETPFVGKFIASCEHFVERLDAVHSVLGKEKRTGRAYLCDIARLKASRVASLCDAAITSPPYAMALPYIDTQRLSLVWLGLLPPDRILELESELIGSREMRGAHRRKIVGDMIENNSRLPQRTARFCVKLQRALGGDDGFRRMAVPTLLYRYFTSMQATFEAVRGLLKVNAPYALVVGHNHTVLGGARFEIDTPIHLARIAEHVGWTVEEIVELQTYRRFGLHMHNAVAAEKLLILRK